MRMVTCCRGFGRARYGDPSHGDWTDAQVRRFGEWSGGRVAVEAAGSGCGAGGISDGNSTALALDQSRAPVARGAGGPVRRRRPVCRARRSLLSGSTSRDRVRRRGTAATGSSATTAGRTLLSAPVIVFSGSPSRTYTAAPKPSSDRSGWGYSRAALR